MKLLYKPTLMTFDFIGPEMPITQGVQKVAGFSRGHHQWHDSVRVGIRNEGKYYPLYLYTYTNGVPCIGRLSYFGALVGDRVNTELRLWKYGASVTCRIFRQDEVTGVWEMFSGPHSSPVKREGFLWPIGYTLGSYFEYDGNDFPSLNIDYKVTNLKLK